MANNNAIGYKKNKVNEIMKTKKKDMIGVVYQLYISRCQQFVNVFFSKQLLSKTVITLDMTSLLMI